MHTVSGSNDNYGSIHMQKGGTGMSTDSGNAINHDSGTITIDDTGVGMASGNGKATNDGQINITGTMSTGMESAKDAENNGTILITGYNSTGMSVVAENGSIVNNKDIIINTSHNGLQNYGMYGSTGVYSRMNNKGNITITGRQYPTTENVAYGMYLDEGEACETDAQQAQLLEQAEMACTDGQNEQVEHHDAAHEPVHISPMVMVHQIGGKQVRQLHAP